MTNPEMIFDREEQKENDAVRLRRLEELVNERLPQWREIDPKNSQWYYSAEIGDAVDTILDDISLWDLDERRTWLDTLDVRMAIERLQAKEKRETSTALPGILKATGVLIDKGEQ